MTSIPDSEVFAEDALRRDAFLNGRLALWQPKTGYRAGADPVFLAAAVPARAGQSVLELGCGAGAALCCLGVRVPGLSLSGLEIQPAYAELARRNASEAGLEAEVVTGDLAQMPAGLQARQFDHVIANPPYFERARGSAAPDAGREMAMGEGLPLHLWIDAARRRLKPGGRLTVIQRAERLPELLVACRDGLGSAAVLPLAARAGRPAKLVILSALKGGRAAFRLLSPVVLHHGERHIRDGDDYSDAARAVLRDGAGWGAFER